MVRGHNLTDSAAVTHSQKGPQARLFEDNPITNVLINGCDVWIDTLSIITNAFEILLLLSGRFSGVDNGMVGAVVAHSRRGRSHGYA